MSKEKASEQFEGQLEGEEILLMFRKHPIVMRKGLIISALGLLIGPLYVLAVSYVKPEYMPTPNQYLLILLGGFIFAGILFFPSWMSWYFSIYLLTNERFVQLKQKGFFDKSVVDIGLDTVTMVNYEIKGIQETLLGFGTIVMQTYVGELVIREVHHPAKLQKEITTKLRGLGFLKQTGAPPSVATSNNE